MNPKYIRVASDLHLEGFAGRNPETLAVDFLPKDERDAESVLVLAGDISSGPEQLYAFLSVVAPRFLQTIFVPGNHEYYRHNYSAWNLTMEDRLKNIDKLLFSTHLMKCALVGNLRFIYGTMWADGGPTMADRGTVGFYLNDFRLISMNAHGDTSYRPIQRQFSVPDMVELFRLSKMQLADALALPHDGKTIVVTHHLPSRRLVSPRFWPSNGGDGANGGFVGDCDDVLANDNAPALWIHGHTHDTFDTELWNTRVVCNPAGYRGEWCSEHNSFMPSVPGEAHGKFVELV